MAEAKQQAPADKTKKGSEAKEEEKGSLKPPGLAPPLSPGPAQYFPSSKGQIQDPSKSKEYSEAGIPGVLIGPHLPPHINAPPKFSMAKKLTGPKSEISPGPGAYEAKNVLGVGVAKYTMRARKEVLKDKNGKPIEPMKTVGPGDYDPKLDAVVPVRKAFTLFPKTKDPFPPQYPGPDYNIPEHHSPGFIIGKTKREQTVPGFASQVSPGPQHPSINIPNMIGTKLPNAPNTKSAIIKNDINPKKQKASDTPSPADYTIPEPKKPGWSMGERHKQASTTFASSTNPIGFVRTKIIE